jgi:hypothetical protein
VLENGSLDLLMEQVRLAAPEIPELNGKAHEDVYLIIENFQDLTLPLNC